MQEIQNEITRNQKAPYIKNFQENYEGGEIPFYAVAEVLSFGSLSKFYKNMVNSDKQAVAKTYGLNFKYFESWIESIAFVRNICAHYGRLYNAKLPKKPRIYKQYTSTGLNNSKVFSVILCMKHIFGCDKEWMKYVNELEKLIAAHSRVNIRTMGFIKDWSEILKRI